MLKANKLFKSYQDTEVIKGLSFEVKKGQFAALYGRSGAGKSTLLHLLSGIEFADSGSIKIDGFLLSRATPEQAADFRLKNIGIVFQFFNLLPTLTIEENILLPNELLDNKNEELLDSLLETLKISDKRKNYPYQVSGGERQRAAVARALINQPSLVLADEPTGNLDSETATSTLELIKEVTQQRQVTVVCATHDERTAGFADKVLKIEDGLIT